MRNTKKAIVVFSGGQDSTLCLIKAVEEFGRANVLALTFDYGQRHAVEVEAACNIADSMDVEHIMLHVDTLAEIGGNALTDHSAEVNLNGGHNHLPSTFVPGRNLIFLTYAAAVALQYDAKIVVTGVSQEDYSGYPDCRELSILLLRDALRAGMEFAELDIVTPCMHKSKADMLRDVVSDDLTAFTRADVLALLRQTHTCYNGKRPPCGECPACMLRAKSFELAGIVDPLTEDYK